MSKAKILKLKTEVTKMESVYSKSSTSDKTKAILKKAIDKAKGEIDKLEGKAAKKEPQPEINLRADKEVRYDSVAQVLAASKRAGLTKLGFITEPQQ